MPVKTSYAKGDVFKTEGLQVSADYSNGTTEILSPDKYILKIDGKTVKDGDKLTAMGKKQVKVYRADEAGYSSLR